MSDTDKRGVDRLVVDVTQGLHVDTQYLLVELSGEQFSKIEKMLGIITGLLIVIGVGVWS